jgi:hypothetical protein
MLTERQLHNFWAKVARAGDNECWVWQASRKGTRKGPGGYGQFKIAGRPLMAHRVSFMIATGRDPGDCFVLHSCDNQACVNPRHLIEGTHQDNMDDMKKKGRQGKKLNKKKALAIRKARGTHREIADRFGVTYRTVGQIKKGETWATI